MCSCLMEEHMNATDWNMFSITQFTLMVGKSFSTHLEDLNYLIVENVNITVNVPGIHNTDTQ